MPSTLTFTDEAPNGTKLSSFTLESLAERMTAREIIRARIYQEVQDFNLNQGEKFHGLVQPTEAEQTFNGSSSRSIVPLIGRSSSPKRFGPSIQMGFSCWWVSAKRKVSTNCLKSKSIPGSPSSNWFPSSEVEP